MIGTIIGLVRAAREFLPQAQLRARNGCSPISASPAQMIEGYI
jgi:hypothetical protein